MEGAGLGLSVIGTGGSAATEFIKSNLNEKKEKEIRDLLNAENLRIEQFKEKLSKLAFARSGLSNVKDAAKGFVYMADDVLGIGLKIGGQSLGRFMLGMNSILLVVDAAQLVKSVKQLVEKKESKAAVEIRAIVSNLEDDLKKLKSLDLSRLMNKEC